MKLITLNLLSPDRKSDLAKRVLFLILKNTLAVILILNTVVAAALLASKLALENTFEALVLQGALITREYSGINTEIRSLNRELRELQKLAEASHPTSPVLAHLAELSKPDITFAAVSINTVNGTVNIRGRASTRDALVAFRGALELSPLLEKIRSPLSNLVLRTDIPFEFEAAIKPPPPPAVENSASP